MMNTDKIKGNKILFYLINQRHQRSISLTEYYFESK
jgi:hypothetical protein